MVRPLRDADTQLLAAVLARRKQVTGILVAEKNRMSRAIPEVRPRIQAHITRLEQELNDLDGVFRNRSLAVGYGGKRTNSCAVFPASANSYR